MRVLTSAASILSLLIAATGWHYLFYSRAVKLLEEIESRELNFKRVLCRRINGGLLMVLGVLIFCGVQNLRPVVFVAIWIAVMAVLATIVVLAMVDMRLTWKLAQSRRRGPRR
jgi:hypothetical protein